MRITAGSCIECSVVLIAGWAHWRLKHVALSHRLINVHLRRAKSLVNVVWEWVRCVGGLLGDILSMTDNISVKTWVLGAWLATICSLERRLATALALNLMILHVDVDIGHGCRGDVARVRVRVMFYLVTHTLWNVVRFLLIVRIELQTGLGLFIKI